MTKNVNTFVLHKVVEAETVDFTDVNVSTLKHLLELCGGDIYNLDEAFLLKQEGSRKVCITFDDGNSSDFDYVLPLLSAHNATATFFIVTDYIGTPGHLNAWQIKELHRQGMQIGSHSLSHQNFLNLPAKHRRRELSESKNKLEDITGANVTSFSFPYGFYNNECVEEVFEAGYSICCTSRHGLCASSDSLVCRNSINARTSKRGIRSAVNAGITQRGLWLCEDYVKAILKRYFHSWYVRFKALLLRPKKF